MVMCSRREDGVSYSPSTYHSYHGTHSLTIDLFDVKQISEPVFDENAIDKLVLEDDKAKDMIKAICMNFTRKHVEDHYSADFIQGKGEGQIL